MEPTILRFPTHCTSKSIERVIDALVQILDNAEPVVIEIDASEIEFITPCALAAMRATFMDADRRGLLASGSRYVVSATTIGNYLRRMDTFAGLAEFDRPEEFQRHDPQDRFVPVRDVENTGSAVEVAQELAAVAAPGMALVQVAIGELTENVAFHARSPGAASAQRYPSTNWVEASIADLGVGIPASLRANPQHADISDEEALRRSIERYVTGTTDRRRGQGLWMVADIAAANGGELRVVSGNGRLIQHASGDLWVGSRSVAWPGTIVTLRLPTDRPLVMSPEFARNDDDDAFDIF